MLVLPLVEHHVEDTVQLLRADLGERSWRYHPRPRGAYPVGGDERDDDDEQDMDERAAHHVDLMRGVIG